MARVPSICVVAVVLAVVAGAHSKAVIPHSELTEWERAYVACRAEDGTLATAISPQLRNRLAEMVTNYFFRTLKVIDTPQLQLLSAGGIPLAALNIKEIMAGPVRSDSDCLYVNSMSFRIGPCFTPEPYICYKPQDSSTTEISSTEISTTEESSTIFTRCGPEGYEYNYRANSCYKYHPEMISWNEAYSVCSREGGHLVIINDAEEAQAIEDMNLMYHLLTGISIGLKYDESSETWKTIDGESLEKSYKNWFGYGGSLTRYPGLLCGSMREHVKLDHWACDSDLMPFLCESAPQSF